VTTINYVITGLGAIGPIVILAGLGYLLWRRRSRLLPRHV
jgi:LPXTG-motif cell wall-anchored protein